MRHGRLWRRALKQGVGFRQTCMRQAQRLGLVGWVRNRFDGSVEVLAQGDADAVATLRTWLAHGPPAARVTRVDAQPAADPEPGLDGFVRRPTL